MLFTDILSKKNEELSPEFDQLFEDILQTQSHPADLLLVQIHYRLVNIVYSSLKILLDKGFRAFQIQTI